MRFMMKNAWDVWRLSAITIGLAFLVAAVLKAINPKQIIAAFVYIWPELPAFAIIASRLLVIIEIVIAGLLLIGIRPRAVLTAAIFMLTSFLAWLFYLELNDLSINCGCGIDASWLVPGNDRLAAISRNIMLIITGLAGAIFAPSQRPLVNKTSPNCARNSPSALGEPQ